MDGKRSVILSESFASKGLQQTDLKSHWLNLDKNKQTMAIPRVELGSPHFQYGILTVELHGMCGTYNLHNSPFLMCGAVMQTTTQNKQKTTIDNRHRVGFAPNTFLTRNGECPAVERTTRIGWEPQSTIERKRFNVAACRLFCETYISAPTHRTIITSNDAEDSEAWNQTTDLLVMSQSHCHCATSLISLVRRSGSEDTNWFIINNENFVL